MLKEEKLLKLQLFAEGGEGGDSTGEAEGNATSGAEIPAFIPEKAKKMYEKSLKRQNASDSQTTETDSKVADVKQEKSERIPYADLIKSDDYKEEHQAYMDKTIGDRLKKYKGIEESNEKMKAVLDIVASKYGLDTNSTDFIDLLREKAEADDSYYENYAMEHDISVSEARKIVSLERKVQRAEEEKAQREKASRDNARWIQLNKNAELTKQRFPDFDLEKEMQNEKFVRLCATNNDDTTAAYMACHWNEIIQSTTQMASQQAQMQTANAIASGKNRPIENGLSSNASAVVTQDFSKMNLTQLRAYAEEQRRKGR